jgi:hypothetical protein
MSIISHIFNGKAIKQTGSTTHINSAAVPKGYVNLSQMCKAGGKRLPDYLTKDKKRLFYFEKVVEIIAAETHNPSETSIVVSDNHNVSTTCLEFGAKSGLLIEVGNAIGGKGDIYGHPQIALSVATWISPELEAWAGYTLLLVIRGDFQALTEEAKQAQTKLDETWDKLRATGIATRRTLTDAIKIWYQRYEATTTCPEHVIYAQCTNNIYQAMWGVNAFDIREYFGLKPGNIPPTRDYLSEKALLAIERAEDRVIEAMEFDDAIPHKNAVDIARIRAARISFKD